MKLKSVEISNYKSFAESGPVEFPDRFTVVTGSNNTGKTAFLEAISLSFLYRPHKSPKQSVYFVPPLQSRVRLAVTFTGLELYAILSRIGTLFYPLSQWPMENEQVAQEIQNLRSRTEVTFWFERASNNAWAAPWPPVGLLAPGVPTTGQHFAQILLSQDTGNFRVLSLGHDPKRLNELAGQIASFVLESLYVFRAERMNITSYQFGNRSVLDSNAANLAEALINLQGRNPYLFDQLNGLVRQIFSNVYKISVKPKEDQGTHAEIVTWHTEEASRRTQLAIPLSDSGTGIGQALAILYVTLTSETPRCIVIDEPNSFLHPGAAKKLVKILRANSYHQFIVATHSPEVIRAASPEKIVAIRWEDHESRIRSVSSSELRDIREVFDDLGVSLSDVFASDRILWVEGATEEECYKMILQSGSPEVLPPVSILGVRSVDEITSKRRDKKLILDIYRKLVAGNALVPAAVGFLFDMEDRSPEEIADLRRESNNQIHFLKRPMFENYLLWPDAIAAAINELPSFIENPIVSSTIEDWINDHGHLPKYHGKGANSKPLTDSSWLDSVDAAHLLNDLIAGLSSDREEYRKTRDAPRITSWLLKHRPVALNELRSTLALASGSEDLR